MRTTILGWFGAASVALFTACGGSASNDDIASTNGAPLTVEADAATCDAGSANAQDASSGTTGLFSCQVDSDCVAVERVDNCCTNGWKIAVARNEVEAYEESTACAPGRHICPLYIVEDDRVATCDETTRTCAMVKPAPSGSGE